MASYRFSFGRSHSTIFRKFPNGFYHQGTSLILVAGMTRELFKNSKVNPQKPPMKNKKTKQKFALFLNLKS